MIIQRGLSLNPDIWPQYTRPAFDDPCFYCGKGIDAFGVLWSGHNFDGEGLDIQLHPDCAKALILRLSRDLWQLETER